MKSIDAYSFNQPLSDLLDQLDEDGVMISQDGKPVALVTRIYRKGSKPGHVIGSLKDKIKIHGDIFSTGIHYPGDCHKYVRTENDHETNSS